MKFIRELFLVGFIGLGCSSEKTPSAEATPPSNTAIDYVQSLQTDVQKAKSATEKANQAVAQTQESVQDFQNQNN